MRKAFCLLLTLAVILSMAACNGESAPTVPATTVPTEPIPTTAPQTEPIPEVLHPISHMTLSLNLTPDESFYMTAYNNEDGTAHIEYMGQIKKVGELEDKILFTLAAAMENTGLAALQGRTEYEEGEAGGYFYVSYADGTTIFADFTGAVPQEFTDAYTAMETVFQQLTADLPDYVPQASVVGEVDPALLTAIQEILGNSGIPNLDGLMISPIAKDEFFPTSAGLTDKYGIRAAASCSAMMMTTPYGMTVVELDENGTMSYVLADFERRLDWGKWVCVMPDFALIAQKDNMALCLMGSGELYGQTAAAIENAGWTVVKTLENPNA